MAAGEAQQAASIQAERRGSPQEGMLIAKDPSLGASKEPASRRWMTRDDMKPMSDGVPEPEMPKPAKSSNAYNAHAAGLTNNPLNYFILRAVLLDPLVASIDVQVLLL